MKLEEAMPALTAACGVPFRKLFAGHPEDLRTNKGNVGQLLLRYIGLKLDSNLTDFEDGELKTNKAHEDGSPRETMYITQISQAIDSLVSTPQKPFARSHLYAKIRNLVYLPVVKHTADVGDWYFVRCVRIEASPGTNLYRKLNADYDAICEGLRTHIQNSSDGFIHTTNGPHYIQVRSKDSMPYNAIYSRVYSRAVSNKNHAFYFMKSFMSAALSGSYE